MSIRRHLDGHAGLVDVAVTSIALPSVSVALCVRVEWRFGNVGLCGDKGGRDPQEQPEGNQVNDRPKRPRRSRQVFLHENVSFKTLKNGRSGWIRPIPNERIYRGAGVAGILWMVELETSPLRTSGVPSTTVSRSFTTSEYWPLP